MDATRMLAEAALKLDVVGICPECGEVVYASDEPVWTCPRDLSPDNNYWQPSEVTEEQRERAGVYSNCYEDFGGYCGDHMPLHGRCYEGYFTVTDN